MDQQIRLETQTVPQLAFSEEDATISTSKQAILNAAQSLLATHGYANLSMRELAAESGLAKATIYHHFQDKNEIFRSVIERDVTMVNRHLVAASEAADGAVAKLSAIIRTYFGLMQERRAIIMSVLRELGNQEEYLCDCLHAQHDAYFAPIIAVLEMGVTEGAFRPLDVEQTAIGIVGTINAFFVFRVLLGKEELDDSVIEHTIALYLRGICA